MPPDFTRFAFYISPYRRATHWLGVVVMKSFTAAIFLATCCALVNSNDTTTNDVTRRIPLPMTTNWGNLPITTKPTHSQVTLTLEKTITEINDEVSPLMTSYWEYPPINTQVFSMESSPADIMGATSIPSDDLRVTSIDQRDTRSTITSDTQQSVTTPLVFRTSVPEKDSLVFKQTNKITKRDIPEFTASISDVTSYAPGKCPRCLKTYTDVQTPLNCFIFRYAVMPSQDKQRQTAYFSI